MNEISSTAFFRTPRSMAAAVHGPSDGPLRDSEVSPRQTSSGNMSKGGKGGDGGGGQGGAGGGQSKKLCQVFLRNLPLAMLEPVSGQSSVVKVDV